MKQTRLCISFLLAFMLVFPAALAGAEASREADYCGIWVADGISVEIWREDGALRCRAVFSDGGEACDIWAYSTCLYDEAGDALQCFGVTRTRERFDSVLGSIEELDWSMDDMSLAGLRLSEDGLRFADDKLDAPVVLTRLDRAERSRRNEALTFAGLWTGEACALRAEDHGACYRFTVTLSADGVTSRQWSYTCFYDPEGGRMASVGVSPTRIITREADGGTVETEEDTAAGDAEFILEDGNRLIWRDVTNGGETAFDRMTAENALHP